jgi:hypothetical protein
MRAGFAEVSKQLRALIGYVQAIHETMLETRETLTDHNRRIAALEVRVEELGRRRFMWPWSAT